MPSKKITLTTFQQSFIRENYSRMSDSEMADELSIRAYHILQFRNENKLMNKAPNEARVFKMKGKWFNVNAVENWVA